MILAEISPIAVAFALELNLKYTNHFVLTILHYNCISTLFRTPVYIQEKINGSFIDPHVMNQLNHKSISLCFLVI